MPQGGALDTYTLAIGNLLLGNARDADALELLGGRLRLQVESPLTVAITGCGFMATLIRDGRYLSLAAQTRHRVQQGDELVIQQGANPGVAYLCIAGGISDGSPGSIEQTLTQGSKLSCAEPQELERASQPRAQFGAKIEMLQVEELAIRANSSALTDAERGYIDAELQSIKGELDNLSTTTFNGVDVFGSSLSFQLGDEVADMVAVDIAAIDAATLGMQNASVDTMSNASSALADIQAGRDALIAQAGALGEASNGIALRADVIRNEAIQVAEANSRMQDADLAAVATDLSESIVKQEAGAIALSHAQANLSSFIIDTM